MTHLPSAILRLLALTLLLFGQTALAKQLWGTQSVSLLYGSAYAVPVSMNADKERLVITLSHASVNSWGDLFTFLDIERSLEGSEPNTLYGEFSPRFSLNKLLQKPEFNGLIKEVYIAPSMEYGASATGFNQINPMLGMGTNFRLPGFKVLQLNGYRRFNQRYADNWQLTTVWVVPFAIKQADFLLDGVADWVNSTTNRQANLHSQIQFKWDAGKALMDKEKTLYLGTEYKYWRNKFGIQGAHESLWQALIRLHY